MTIAISFDEIRPNDTFSRDALLASFSDQLVANVYGNIERNNERKEFKISPQDPTSAKVALRLIEKFCY